MEFGKSVIQGIMGAFLKGGIDVEKFDLDNQILYLSIPRESYEYHLGSKVNCAEEYAKSIKKSFIELNILKEPCTVKFREKDIYWTKDMGDMNYDKNFHKVISLTLWDK